LALIPPHVSATGDERTPAFSDIDQQREESSMQSKIAAAAALALGAIAFAAPARSADLPQAGSSTTHSAVNSLTNASRSTET
jgi:hypothetical protein